jgi:hypothetical protein
MKCKLSLTAEEMVTLNEMAALHPLADFRPRALGLLALGDGIPVCDIAHSASPMSLAEIADCIHRAQPEAPDFSHDALVRALHSRHLSCQRTRLSLSAAIQ